MKTYTDIFKEGIECWRLNKGVGTALIPPKLNDKEFIFNILINMYNKHPTTEIAIITTNFNDRESLVEYFKTSNKEYSKKFDALLTNKLLKVFTETFVFNPLFHLSPKLYIFYRPKEFDERHKSLIEIAKFKLVILNERLSPQSMMALYSVCPLINAFRDEDIRAARLTTPVEETFIQIDIDQDTEDYKILKYFDDYIATSFSIFGDFPTMNKARVGDSELNLSYTEVCYNIANNNGWNTHLDMSIELNRKLDEIYNPMSLHSRASETYEIIHKRTKFLSEYEHKLEKILELVKTNNDKKILIINKSGDFANKVTDYINSAFDNIICGNFHDKVEPIPAKDDNGNQIYYKSGNNIGKSKMLASQAQKTLVKKLFNLGSIRVISTNNAPDKELNINVDMVIITSPLCEEIESYLYRLSDVIFASPLKLYTVSISSSIEEKTIQNRRETKYHKFMNELKNNSIGENNFPFTFAE